MAYHPHAWVLNNCIVPTEGFGDARDFTAFMLRATPGATVDVDDDRMVQAAVYWWRRFGGGVWFAEYLETIPPLPDCTALREKFPLLWMPILIDPRLGHVQTAQCANLAFEEYGYTNETLVPSHRTQAFPTDRPYWVLANDGEETLGKRALDWQKACEREGMYAATLELLFALWVQRPPRTYTMSAPETRHATHKNQCACVLIKNGKARVIASEVDFKGPKSATPFFVPLLS